MSNETDDFAAKLAKGTYKHLTPRPTRPDELALEQVARLFFLEKQRMRQDKDVLLGMLASYVPATVLIACGLIAAAGILMTANQLNTVMGWALPIFAILLVSIPPVVTWRSKHKLSVAWTMQGYENLMLVFQGKLERLARALDMTGIADLEGQARNSLAQAAIIIGTGHARAIRNYEARSTEPTSVINARERRRWLSELHDVLEDFDLAPSSSTDYFRAADAELAKSVPGKEVALSS